MCSGGLGQNSVQNGRSLKVTMKVIYTEAQKKHAIQTYKKYKSYSKTLRVLGYPSRHVLY